MRGSSRRWLCHALIGAAVAAVAALASPAAADAHGGGSYRSAVVSINPPLSGIEIKVASDNGDLQLIDHSTAVVVIDGYAGEPYLRFTPLGVYRNTRSPATYLNDSSYDNAPLPDAADPEAPPHWVKIADGPAYEWHDHRTHWMGSEPPRQVQDSPGKRSHLFDWNVDGTAGGARFVVSGTLDWVPQGGPVTQLMIGLLLLNVVFLGALAMYVGAVPSLHR
jgi:hypothetical protein